MKLPISLALITLLLVGDAADAGRRKRRHKKRPKPVPTQPAPAPAPTPTPVPEFQPLPSGTYTGVLGGQQITFTATPMAFYTLYGNLHNNDPEVSSAYVSGNYNNWMNHMGIVFVYLAHDGTIHRSVTFSGTYLLLENGTLIFTGEHGTAVFSQVS